MSFTLLQCWLDSLAEPLFLTRIMCYCVNAASYSPNPIGCWRAINTCGLCGSWLKLNCLRKTWILPYFSCVCAVSGRISFNHALADINLIKSIHTSCAQNIYFPVFKGCHVSPSTFFCLSCQKITCSRVEDTFALLKAWRMTSFILLCLGIRADRPW